MGVGFFHHDVGPVVIIVTCARCYLIESVVWKVAAVGLVAAIDVGIIVGGEVASASPAFVAYSEIFEFPGLLASVLFAQTCHGAFGRCDIFDPLSELFDRAASHVAAQIGLASDQFAEVEKLVCSEWIVLDSAAPVIVDLCRAVFGRTYAVAPVIFVGKASSGPSHYGHFEIAQGLEHVVTVAWSVGDRWVGAYPQASVYAWTEMLGKLAVYLRHDNSLGIDVGHSHRNSVGIGCGRCY